MRFNVLKTLLSARRRRRARGDADEPLLDDPEKRQALLKRIALGMSANKFPPR
jgi:hypothetical protein